MKDIRPIVSPGQPRLSGKRLARAKLQQAERKLIVWGERPPTPTPLREKERMNDRTDKI